MTQDKLREANDLQTQITDTQNKLGWLHRFQQESEAIAKIHRYNPKYPHDNGIQNITIHYNDHITNDLDITLYSDMYALLSAVIADQEQHLKELNHLFATL